MRAWLVLARRQPTCAIAYLVGPVAGMERLRRLEDAGVHEVFVWPVGDEVAQIRMFAELVTPHFTKATVGS